MRNVLSVIKWSVCTAITPAGDIYSRTLVHARAHCTKDLGMARTILQILNALVQALRRGSILDRMKISTSKRRNPLSSKAE